MYFTAITTGTSSKAGYPDEHSLRSKAFYTRVSDRCKGCQDSTSQKICIH